MRKWLTMGLVPIAAMACSAPPPEACKVADESSVCLDHRYFRSYDPLAVDRCTPGPVGADLHASVSVRLFRGPGLSDADVFDQTLRMQRFYDPYGLTFHASGGAEPTGLAYAMSGSRAQIEQALDKSGIPLQGTLTDDEMRLAHRIVGDVIFADLRTFASAHPSADPHLIHFLLLDRVMEPQLSEYMFGSTVSGLLGFGLSPAMLARLDPGDPERDLYEVVGLPQEFAPLIIIGQRDIGDAERGSDNVAAHEAGHAMGLAHTTDPDNLMYPSPRGDCDASLSVKQLVDLSTAVP